MRFHSVGSHGRFYNEKELENYKERGGKQEGKRSSNCKERRHCVIIVGKPAVCVKSLMKI